MKLSQIILEEYQDASDMIPKYREVFEKGLEEQAESRLKVEYLRVFETLTTLTQAYKDALYMEEQIERAKPIDIGKLKEEWDSATTQSQPLDTAITIEVEPCHECGSHMAKNESTILLSNPPQYKYECEGCGDIQYKFY